jgi:hypothetical protein
MKDDNATEKTPPPLDEDDIALLKTYVSFLFLLLPFLKIFFFFFSCCSP